MGSVLCPGIIKMAPDAPCHSATSNAADFAASGGTVHLPHQGLGYRLGYLDPGTDVSGDGELMAATYLTFEIWITIALLYLIMTLTCSLAVERVETHMAKNRR